MADVVEQRQTLVEKHRAAEAKRRGQAVERYRELLLRNRNPRRGDEDALGEVMRELGRVPEDLAEDVGAAEEISRYQQLAEQVEQLQAESSAALKRHAELLKLVEAAEQKLRTDIDEKVKPAEVERNAAESRLRDAQRAEGHAALANDHFEAICEDVDLEVLRERRRVAGAADSVFRPRTA